MFTKIKNWIINPDILSPLIVVILATVAGWWLLLPGYYNMHDDLQMMRQLIIETCLRDGQIPCRWTQHMGYGYGFPLFNYYPQLPYIVGEVFRVIGFSFVNTAKLLFFTSLVASGIAMYFLAREFWGRQGGIISSAFYIWAPYHSLDIYVRGAMNEAWALVWFPLILLSSYKLIITSKFKYIIILALGFYGLLNSHNLMVLIFTPLFAVWCLMWILKNKSWRVIPKLILSGLWAFGLSAFFTIPVAFEQKFVQVESLIVGYYDYVAHFTTLNQLLISRFWGYGASVWGEEDRMSFQLGYLHWILPTLLLIYVLWKYYKDRKIDNTTIVTSFFVMSGWFALFMAHNKSTPLWVVFNDVLKFVQFPWRFLTLAIFSFSAVAGSFVLLPFFRQEKVKNWSVLILIIILIIFNVEFFRPEKMGPLTDQEKYSDFAWDLQQTSGIYDYLPVTAQTAPKSPQKTIAEVSEGDIELSNMSQTSNKAYVVAEVKTDNAILQINILQYPGWEVYVDGARVETFVGEDPWGRIHIKLSKGKHEISARFVDTPVRKYSNMISMISWVGLLSIPLWKKRKD